MYSALVRKKKKGEWNYWTLFADNKKIMKKMIEKKKHNHWKIMKQGKVQKAHVRGKW